MEPSLQISLRSHPPPLEVKLVWINLNYIPSSSPLSFFVLFPINYFAKTDGEPVFTSQNDEFPPPFFTRPFKLLLFLSGLLCHHTMKSFSLAFSRQFFFCFFPCELQSSRECRKASSFVRIAAKPLLFFLLPSRVTE